MVIPAGRVTSGGATVENLTLLPPVLSSFQAKFLDFA